MFFRGVKNRKGYTASNENFQYLSHRHNFQLGTKNRTKTDNVKQNDTAEQRDQNAKLMVNKGIIVIIIAKNISIFMISKISDTTHGNFLPPSDLNINHLHFAACTKEIGRNPPCQTPREVEPIFSRVADGLGGNDISSFF